MRFNSTADSFSYKNGEKMRHTWPPVACATLPISISRQSVSATDRTDTTTLDSTAQLNVNEGKRGIGKGFPYSIPSVGPGADPGVQAVSPQVTV